MRFRTAAHPTAAQYFRTLFAAADCFAFGSQRRHCELASQSNKGPSRKIRFKFKSPIAADGQFAGPKKSPDAISCDREMRMAIGAAAHEIGGDRPGMIHADDGALAFGQDVARNQRRSRA